MTIKLLLDHSIIVCILLLWFCWLGYHISEYLKVRRFLNIQTEKLNQDMQKLKVHLAFVRGLVESYKTDEIEFTVDKKKGLRVKKKKHK